MKKKCRIRIAQDHFDALHRHLFPGDKDEHGAVLLAGISQTNGRLTLLVRELHLAVDGVDYTDGKIGYRFRLSFGDSGAAQSASSFLGSFIRLSATREFGFVVRIVQLSIISLLG